MLDSDLLLEKSALLEKEGRVDEFLDTVRTLLSQHCPIIRDRDEAKCESSLQNQPLSIAYSAQEKRLHRVLLLSVDYAFVKPLRSLRQVRNKIKCNRKCSMFPKTILDIFNIHFCTVSLKCVFVSILRPVSGGGGTGGFPRISPDVFPNIKFPLWTAMFVGLKVRENTLKQLRKMKPETYYDPVSNGGTFTMHCSSLILWLLSV